MQRSQYFVIAYFVILAFVGFIHYALWVRLFRDTKPSRFARRAGALGLAILFVSLPLASNVARTRGPQPWAWVAFTWMGFMFYLFLALGIGELVYLVRARNVDPERRTFLRRAIGSVAAFAAVSVSAYGMNEALRRLRLVTVEIPLTKLPKALDGFTIVQLSDIHVGSTIGKRFIEELVARVNAEKADLVAITGDLVDGSVAHLGDAIAPLASLTSTHGTYFVTGNHEYYSGAVAWCEELSRIGLRVLRNERVAIADGLDVAGVDDWHAKGHAPGHGPDLDAALRDRDPSRAIVLLAHQPVQALDAADREVDLQLSGHTHGGQLWPFRYLVPQPFIAGIGRKKALTIYTSRGTGYWGPPMRVGAPAEITKIILRCA